MMRSWRDVDDVTTLRAFGRHCRWMRRSWTQPSAPHAASSWSSPWGRAENSKVEKKRFLHLYFLTQWLVSVWWLWTPSHRVRPPVVRVPSRRLADPLGSSCGHECQDAGRGLQDRLALQVSGPDGELDVRQADLSCAYAVCVRTHAGGSCRSPRRLTCRIPGTNTNRWRSAATDRWARHVHVTLLVWVVVDIRFVKCMNLTWWGVDSSPVRRVVEQCHHS